LKLSSAKEIITLDEREQDSAFEGAEVKLSFRGILRKRMIGVEMETSPKKLGRSVGDCGFRMGTSDISSETLFFPV
jgi:hypothetical protein